MKQKTIKEIENVLTEIVQDFMAEPNKGSFTLRMGFNNRVLIDFKPSEFERLYTNASLAGDLNEDPEIYEMLHSVEDLAKDITYKKKTTTLIEGQYGRS